MLDVEQRRLERDFHIRPSISTGYRWFHAAADQIDLSRDYEPWAVEGFSGYLAIDELYDGFAILVATDPVNDKTIAVRLCESANEQELRAFLLHLKGLGITPKVIVTDGSTLYKDIPRQIWGTARHQLCVFHYTRLVTNRVLEAVGSLSKQLRKNPEMKECAKKLWKIRYCFVKRPENLTEWQKQAVQEICSSHTEIAYIRQFMERVFKLLERGQTREEAIEKHMDLL